MNKPVSFTVINVLLFFSLLSGSKAQDASGSISITAMLLDDKESIPFPKVELTSTPGPNAPQDAVQCDSQVDSYSGQAQCFINPGVCEKDSKRRVKFTVNLSDEEFYTASPGRHIDVFIRGCRFVTPPTSHTVTYRHNRRNRYRSQRVYFNALLGNKSRNDLQPVLGALATKVQTALATDSSDAIANTFNQSRAGMDGSISYLQLAQRYPEDSPYRQRFLDRAESYQAISVQIVNSAMKSTLEQVVAGDTAAAPKQPIVVLKDSARLTDFYNNLNQLVNNKDQLSQVITNDLSDQDKTTVLLGLGALQTANGLNPNTVNNLEEITKLIQR